MATLPAFTLKFPIAFENPSFELSKKILPMSPWPSINNLAANEPFNAPVPVTLPLNESFWAPISSKPVFK